MKTPRRFWSWSLLGWAAAAGIAAAQQPPPAATATASGAAAPVPGAPAVGAAKAAGSSAQTDAGEPRAVTSPPGTGTASAQAVAPPAAMAPPPAPPAPPGRSAGSSGRPAGAAAAQRPQASDRVELGTATVTGDREQPKVMYIVPWKKPDMGDLSGKPLNSLLDEVLAPVDRDEFKREVTYYDAVKSNASQNGASPAGAAQGER